MPKSTATPAEVLESFVNGNISWCKTHVQSLNKKQFAGLIKSLMTVATSESFDLLGKALEWTE